MPDENKPQARKLTNKEYPYLPDAPTLVSILNFDAPSPYHETTLSKDEIYAVRYHICEMAIAFVRGYSKIITERLDFSLRSLEIVDKFINDYKFKDKEDLTLFVALVGSYLGEVIRSNYHGIFAWHVSQPIDYIFSALRFKQKIETPEGKIVKEKFMETNPFAQVSKKVIAVLQKRLDDEISMIQYVNYLTGKNKK